MMITVRNENQRGKADHGWLKSSHSFSFASYYDPKHMGFGPLRVINEDKVVGGAGFPPHPHKDMEILTFVLQGALAHKDSMGNESVIRPGEIQLMSAGSGVVHSEYNHHPDEEVHLYQIWIESNRPGIEPRYQQKTYHQPENGLELLVSSQESNDEGIKIYQRAKVFLGHIDDNKELQLDYKQGHQYWLQLIEGEALLGDHKVIAGDGIGLKNETKGLIRGLQDSRFLFFEFQE